MNSIPAAINADPNSPEELGDLLISYLEHLSVDYVFGIPGGAIEPLYNALARSEKRGGPRSITARHETGAAFMAEGYTRATGKIGVFCATTGPGATNLITGVASAYENQIPMLVITAQTALSNFGKGAFQESSCTGIDILGMFKHCTRYNTMVSHTDQFQQKLVAALMTAHQNPNGPVHLSIPIDILGAKPSSKPLNVNLPKLIHQRSILDIDASNELCQQLDQANNIVLVIGADCSDSIGIILEFALLVEAQIVTTPDGKGLISPFHPLYRGVIGFAGHDTANELLINPTIDLVVTIGSRLGEWATGGWDSHTILTERLVHIESVEGRLTRSPMAKLHMRGDFQTIFKTLLSYPYENQGSNDSVKIKESWNQQVNEDSNINAFRNTHFNTIEQFKCFDTSTPLKPQRLMHQLTNLFPPHTHYIADVGNSMAWAIHYLQPFDRRLAGQRDHNSCLLTVALEFAAMGWAIGLAIGFALGRRNQPVVCITGDGSVLMNGQELTVAIQEQLPVIFIILNDSAYGMVKHGQRLTNAEETSFQLPTINFAAIAEAMGATGVIIQSDEDLLALNCKEMLKRKGPTVLDVRIDAEESPPIASRIKVLTSVARGTND